MGADAVPMEVDLRQLSQSELRSMASSDPKSFDLRQLTEVEPKIDRSVFNESAGSRKQTYSRLPLSPTPDPTSLPRRRGRPRLHLSPPVAPPPPPPAPAPDPDPAHDENRLIVSYLRQLLDSGKIDPEPQPRVVAGEMALALVPVPVVPVEETGDSEIRNAKGEVVDLVGLATKGDLFGEEMRRRTQGLTTAEQILGYMTGLDGQWGSRRRKRKIVDAAVFGDELPKGWKLLLGLKRKEGVVFLNCRRYVSPTGRQFMSCKEVSSYIISLVGHQDAGQTISDQHDAHTFLHSPVPLPPPPAATINHIPSDNTHKENLHIMSFPGHPFELGPANAQIHSKRVDEVHERASVLMEEGDREMRNRKGEVIDLVRLAENVDLFGEEIKRRTVGMRTEEQILGYMKGLHGQWGSQRKKRKIVDAGIFGDELPKGWKLLLGMKRKEGIVYLNCRRYVSPSGKQFMSCKEVASYILSLVWDQDAQPISCQYDTSAPRPDKLTSKYVTGTIHQDGSNKDLSNCSYVTPISCVSAECEKQGLLYRYEKPGMTDMENMLDCRKCKMTFRDQDAQIKHMMTSHGRGAKRRKLGKSLGDVIVKDGKFECQFCHKTFNERHRYNGHIGAHVRYQSLHGVTTGTSNSSSSLALVPYAPGEMDISANQKEETCTIKSVDEVHIASLQCRSGMENNEDEHNRKPDAPEITESVSRGKFVDGPIKDCDMIDDKSKEFAEASNVIGVKSSSCSDAAKPDAPEISVSVSRGEFVDDPTKDCHTINDKFKEFTEASNVTDVKSPSCRDATCPSVTDVEDPAQACSPIVTQEASASKSVHFENDYELTSDRSGIIEENLTECAGPNVCLDAIAPAATNMDIAPCETISETVLPSSTRKFIDGNISDHIMNDHKPEDIVDSNNSVNIGTISDTGGFVNDQSNYHDMADHNSGVNTACPMSVEGNASFNDLSPSVTPVGNATFGNSNLVNSSSCTAVSPVHDYNGEQNVEVVNHLIALSGNGLGFGVEDYTNTMFTSSVEEHVVVDTSTDGISVTGTCGTLTDKDTPITSTMHNDLNTGYVIPAFAREQSRGIGTNADCMFPGDLNKSILEEFDEVGNELHDCFHSSNAGCEDAATVDIINNDDGRQTLQANVDNKSSSWVPSSNSPLILDMLQDQCEDEHANAGPKSEQEKLSGFEEMRLGNMEPTDFVLLTAQAPGSVARPPIEFLSSDQLEWSISLPKVDSTVPVTSVCVWCNGEFIIEDGVVEPQSGSLGYMCPECKTKISGQLDLLGGFP